MELFLLFGFGLVSCFMSLLRQSWDRLFVPYTNTGGGGYMLMLTQLGSAYYFLLITTPPHLTYSPSILHN